MLASKTAFPATLGANGSSLVSGVGSTSVPLSRRTPTAHNTTSSFANPTESEFEDDEPNSDAVKNWDEDRVCDYLRSVKCGEYEKLFRKNHINGENLLELDKDVLKEMGVEKVGDRVRLFLSIKKLRTKAYANQKKRNRVCPCLYHQPSTLLHHQASQSNMCRLSQKTKGFLWRTRCSVHPIN